MATPACAREGREDRMRRTNGLGLLAALLLGLCGCVATDREIRPPVLPEEYNTPPATDSRYLNPPRFPKETMNKGTPRRSDAGGAPPTPGSMRSPTRPGMSGF